MPLLPHLPRAYRAPGRALRAALTVSAALLLTTCSGDTPVGPGRAGIGALRVAPQFDAYARLVPLALDRARVIVVRPPSTTIADTTLAFSPNSSQIEADVSFLLQGTQDLYVTLQLLSGTTLLFEGTDTIQVTAGRATQASSIPVTYQGPGNTITSLSISPRDSTVPLNAVVQFGATAADPNGPVGSFYVSWSSSGGAINAAGSFTAPGARDTVLIVAVTPNQVRDSTRVFIVAAASTMTKTSGDQQTALASSRLSQPLEVLVTGTDALPVAGVAVNFAATTGGGSVDSAVAHTDASGFARTGATLGSTVGQQTFTASAAGLSSVVFSATATSGIVWTGAVNTDWHTAGNWNPAQVPGINDNATIPVTSNQPVASTTVNVNDLTIAGGATVTLATTFTFNVAGNLTANGSLLVSGGTPTIQLSGAGKTLSGQVANASITGTIALAGSSTVTGNVAVSGGTASLDIGIFAMQVGGNFSTGSGGRLIMTTGGGQLNITGAAAFGGRDETGFLTAGTIAIGGNFSQTGSGSATSFAPSGGHTTGFTGAAATHTVNFGTPGAGAAGSHFNALDISTTGTVSLATDVNVDGLLSSAPSGAPPTLGTTGATHRLTAVSVSVTGLVVNQATLAIGSGTIVAFNGVQFTNSPTTVAQLTVNNPGTASAFTFSNLNFATTPVGPNGFYMDVTDADGIAPSLVINMVSPTPATPGAFVRTTGGAAVNWPSTLPIVTWDGSASPSWADPNNWTPAQVPTLSDDVVIPSGTPNSPVFSTSCSAKSLTVNNGATFNLVTGNCQVAGNVFADGAITGTGALQIATTAQIRGTFPSLQLSGAVTAVGTVLTTGSVTVTGATGSFTVAGHGVTIGTSLVVQSGALLIMTNGSDVVNVAGNAIFSGGNELGSLSAGTLTIGGNLSQANGTTGDTYHTSGTHLTVFTGNSPVITFGTPGDVPGTSHFEAFAWTGTGTLTLGSDVYAHTGFTTASTSPLTITSPAGRLLQVGSYTSAGPVTLTNVRLGLNEPTGGPLSLNNVTFQGLASTAIQLTVSHPGTGGPFTFNALTFSVTPTGAGRYLSVTDADGATPTALTINVTNSTPSSGGSFVTVANGAVVNWPFVATPIWNGNTSPNWSVATNWSTGTVPTGSDSVVIPFVGNQPVLSANVPVGAVNITGGTLTLNGHILTVARTFATFGAGTVTMTNAADSLRVTGNASFGGANENNLLSAGTTTIGGNFSQLGNAGSYAATGTHQTIFTGSPVITFANPGPGVGFSHFHAWGLHRPSTVTLGSDVVSEGATGGIGNGTLSIQGTTGQSVTLRGNGGGGGGADSGAVIFSNVRLIIDDQTTAGVDTLDNFTFQGLPTTAVQLTINTPGGATPVALRNITFSVIPTTGFYISATDVAPGDGIPLVVDVINGSPASGGAFVQVAGGAQVNWPAIFPSTTWTGITDGDWFKGTNWSTGVVPTGATDVVIPSGTLNGPVLGAIGAVVKSLTVNSGATLSLAGFTLTTNGNLFADGPITSTTGVIAMAAAGQVRGTLPGLQVNATVSAIGTTFVTGNLTISGAGANFTAGAVNTIVTGNLLTQTSGTVTMNNTNDVVSVLGSATFNGGDETGKLTQGVLQVEGNFTQSGTTTSFAAGGSHTTQLISSGQGPAPVVNFGSPANSRFQNLDVSGANVVILQTSVTVLGQLSSVPGGALDTLRAAAQGPVLTAGGAIVQGLVMDGVPMVLSGGSIVTFSKATFRNQSPTGTALAVNNTGAGGPFTFDQLSFTTTLAGGLHLAATDLDGATNGVLTINVTNSSPATGAGVSQANGGAVINWPAAAPIAQWTGSAGNSVWRDAANWSTNALPGPTDSVVIPNVGTQPVLAQDETIGAVNVSGGDIGINGHVLTVARTFATTGIGTLTMTNSTDRVVVGGNASFAGAGGGVLTAGVLEINGNFAQLGGAANFAASSGHTTLFNAPNPSISFQAPTASHFGALLSSLFSPTFTLGSNVTVLGTLNGGDGFGGTINGLCGSVLTVQNVFSGGMTLDCISLVIDDPSGTVGAVSNITFLNQAANVDQLTIRHPGLSSASFGLSNITWTPLSSGSGSYINAVDVDGVAPALVVNVSSNNPGNGPVFTKTSGGAGVLWPGAPIQWSGAQDDGWINGANWIGGVAPIATNDAQVPSGTPFSPRVTGTQGIKNLIVQSGATLTINDATLNVSGSVTSNGTITEQGGGVLSLNGTGQTVTGSLGTASVAAGANYVLAGPAAADVSMSVSGSLGLNGNTLNVAGTFSTSGTGALAMTNPADQLIVTGDANFGGGNTTGLLTGGLITVGGAFNQTGTTSPLSFNSSGTTVLFSNPTTPQLISFTNPAATGGSRFLDVSVASGGVTLSTNVLISTIACTGPLKINGHTLTVDGNFILSGSAGTLTMQNAIDTLVVVGAANFLGGSTSGLMTAGVLRLGSSLQANGVSALSFAPSGTHKTVMASGNVMPVSFVTPGTGGAGSHFNALDVTGATAGVNFTSAAFVDSALIASVGAAAPKISGVGFPLTAKQWLVTGGLQVTNVPMVLNEGTAILTQQFTGVTFAGFPTTATSAILIDVTAAGLATGGRFIDINGTQLQTTLGAGGLYVRAASSNGIGYTLRMIGSNDPTGGFSRSQAIAPAVIQYQ